MLKYIIMDTFKPERNPQTHARHRHQVLLQIILPTLIGAIILIALLVLVIVAGVSGNNEVSRWADISLVWLLLPGIGAALLLLLFLVILTIGLTRLLHVFPIFAFRLQSYVFMVESGVKRAMDGIVEPILKINSFMASARRLLKRG